MRRSPDLPYVVALLALFAASRALVYALGVRFWTAPLTLAMQLLDTDLLRHRLLESVWNLHSQPPLYNVGLGVVLKLAGPHWIGTFQIIQIALGAIEVVALYFLLGGVGLPRLPSALVAAFVSVSPASLLYESWLFYDYPVLVLLTLSALALQRFAARPTTARSAAFFSLLAVVIFTRSLYQPIWFVLALALVLWLGVGSRGTILRGAAVPFALLLALTIKQQVMFGTPATSSWVGMNMSRIAVSPLSDAERRAYVRSGELDPIQLIPPLSPPDAFFGVLGRPKPRGIPALDQVSKRDGGERNGNNWIYLEASRRYRQDTLPFILDHPGAYLHGVKLAASRYFWPPTYSGVPEQNKRAIGRWEAFYNLAIYGSTPYANRISFIAVLLYGAATVYGFLLLIRRRSPVLAFVWVTLVYTTLIATLTDYGENYRLRLPVEPLVVVLLAAGAQRAWLARPALERRNAEAVV
jgi:hypothetical protein